MRILIRRIFRLVRLFAHLCVGLLQAGALFGFYSARQRDQVISRWSAKLLRILGVRLQADAPPSLPGGALLVANHVSWLDIFVILAAQRVHFVSKHEIRNWPVGGWLAHRAGTLFIQRAKKADTARINQEMHTLLQEGAWVAVFPEGTSTNGLKLLRFLPSLFQAAVAQNLPVVPATLRYLTSQGHYTAAAVYADEISIGQSLWSITGEKELVAKLQFCTPIRANPGQDRRQLAAIAHREIATTLGLCAVDTPPESPDDLPAAMP